MRLILAAGLLICLVCATVPLESKAARPLPPADGILVKFRGDPRVKLVPVPPGEDFSLTLRRWERYREIVEYVEPNATYTAALVPNDPLYPDQWALPAINAPEAWDETTGAPSVTVAVLDTGVDVDHPDLASVIAVNAGETGGNGIDDDGNGLVDDVNGWDFVENVADPSPKFDGSETTVGTHHGTVVGGIAAATGNNGTGVAGVAWNVKLLPIRVLDGQGIGTTLLVAQGIAYAVDRGASVINLSFVGSSANATLDQAIADARNAGVAVVAAAGNEGVNLDVSPRYPVCTAGVIGVAALTATNTRASFSNYGRSCIDLAAPGEDITSTAYEDAGRGYLDPYANGWFGTSVAAPYVAGVVALTASAHPDWTRAQIESSLLEHTASVAGDATIAATLGAGGLNAAGAIQATPTPIVLSDILTFPGPGGGPQVRRFLSDSRVVGQFFAFEKSIRSGGSIAGGRLAAAGAPGIAVGSNDAATVRVFNERGALLTSFAAFPSTVTGGIVLAAGDVDGDGTDEIAVGLRAGSSQVRVFTRRGKLIGQFFAYAKTFRGGVTLAVADLDADGRAEIITGTGVGAPQIRIFSGRGTLRRQFYAFDRAERNGVVVAAGDVAGTGVPEIVASRGVGAPHVRLFTQAGERDREFLAYASGFRGGVTLSVADLNADGRAEIVTGTGVGAPQVRVFDGRGKAVGGFFAYAKTFRGGVRLSTIVRTP